MLPETRVKAKDSAIPIDGEHCLPCRLVVVATANGLIYRIDCTTALLLHDVGGKLSSNFGELKRA